MEVLRGAVIDGRAENVRYRQNQLHQLHASLRDNTERICDAISQDQRTAKEHAEIEFFLAMDSVTKAYEALDFESSLQAEYLVKEGKDNLLRRVGVGLVAIRPGNHNRFYSTVTPLAMAIAAGNCVLLEV
jgi:acyl-CoA reductase-like NAD-dependent aldehyde dehydrogenase